MPEKFQSQMITTFHRRLTPRAWSTVSLHPLQTSMKLEMSRKFLPLSQWLSRVTLKQLEVDMSARPLQRSHLNQWISIKLISSRTQSVHYRPSFHPLLPTSKPSKWVLRSVNRSMIINQNNQLLVSHTEPLTPPLDPDLLRSIKS